MASENPFCHPSEEEVFIFPASFAQQRLWFLEQLVPDTCFYNVPTVLRLLGAIDRSALEQSFHAIVCRHETLRTTFDMVDGQPVQVIASHHQVSLPLVDLRSLPASDRDAEAQRLLRESIQRPFHLRQGPLMRLMLLQLDEREFVLLLNLHHIIFDEWSSGLLIQELGTLYAAFCAGKPSSLPALPIQYADFAHWQREWLQGEVLATQLAYWRQQLAGVSVLELPIDRSRPTVQSHRGTTQQLELPQRLVEALESLCQQEGATLFMVLLAAFQVVLSRYTGQEDIAVGSPIANRNRSELEGLIGFFVNSLVLRSDLAGNPTFRELLGRVREVALAAYAHQDVPFEKLVEALHPERHLDRNPLFQVVFALQNAPMEQLELPGLTLNAMNFETQTARFDLELYLWDGADNFRNLWGNGWSQSAGLRGVLVYNTDLFDRATILRLLGSFQTLLDAIVANPDQRLADLPVLTPAEQQWFAKWNQTQTAYPHDRCLHQLFEAQVAQLPDAIAVSFDNKQFTYQALNSGSNQLAHYLQKLGVGTASRVGVCLERSAEMVAAFLGVLKAGGAYVPLDPTDPPERLRFMLEEAQVSVVLTQQQWAEQFESQTTVCLDRAWDAIAQESDANPTSGATADSLAYVVYTSGSTGTPKGVAIPHRAVVRLVCHTNYVQLTPDDRVAQASNCAFDAATFEIWGALLNGAQLIGIDRATLLSPQLFAARLQQQQLSVLFLTTALLNQVVSEVPTAFATLRYLLFGGEAADPRWVRAILAQGAPQHLLHVYGPTESTTFASWYEVRDVSPEATSIPIGRPVANTQLYVLDAHLNPVPIGVRGELYIGGDGLAEGYLKRSELTAERFVERRDSGAGEERGAGEEEGAGEEGEQETGLQRTENSKLSGAVAQSAAQNSKLKTPQSGSKRQNSKLKTQNSLAQRHEVLLKTSYSRLYKTGDLARYRADGNLEFLGRVDDQVKLRGFRVELGEIEAVLSQHEAVQTAIAQLQVIPNAEDHLSDRRLVAYIVSTQTPAPTASDLRWFLKAKLPGYMVPSTFVVVPSLPLTPNGKVDRRALLAIMGKTAATDASTDLHQPPQTAIEQTLATLWGQILGLQQVSVHANFFELGGHSLLATQLMSRVRDTFRVEVPLRSLFETPTIAGLAKQIEAMSWAAQGVQTTGVVGATVLKREEVEF